MCKANVPAAAKSMIRVHLYMGDYGMAFDVRLSYFLFKPPSFLQSFDLLLLEVLFS